eukprot:gene46785-42846_t
MVGGGRGEAWECTSPAPPHDASVLQPAGLDEAWDEKGTTGSSLRDRTSGQTAQLAAAVGAGRGGRPPPTQAEAHAAGGAHA